MSNCLTIKAAKKDSYIFLVNSNQVPIIEYGTAQGDPIPMDTLSSKFEFLEQGGKADRFRNKAVTHCSIRGDIDITFDMIGLPTRIIHQGTFIYSQVYSNNQWFTIREEPGSSQAIKYTYGIGREVLVQNDSTGYVMEGWFNNRKTYTTVHTREVEYLNGSLRKRRIRTILTRSTTKYGESLGERPFVDDQGWSDWSWAKNIGQVRNGDFKSYSTRYISKLKRLEWPILSDIVPDDFNAQLFDKLPILQVNNIENLREVKKLKSLLDPILKIVKRRSIRSVAELYLWYKYEYQTTKMDIEEVVRLINKLTASPKYKQEYQKLDLTFSSDGVYLDNPYCKYTRYHVYIKTYSASIFESLGLELNMSNTWDLIPFSFVVDWFVKVGDCLKALDDNDKSLKLDVLSVCSSTKSVIPVSTIEGLPVYGHVELSFYQRNVSKTLPTPIVTLNTNNPLHHIIDGSALYLATKRGKMN